LISRHCRADPGNALLGAAAFFWAIAVWNDDDRKLSDQRVWRIIKALKEAFSGEKGR
jgi:hypothetical protein